MPTLEILSGKQSGSCFRIGEEAQVGKDPSCAVPLGDPGVSRYHALISEFNKQYGMGVIINTSFNIRGEPIVESPEDAFKCFMRTNMDALMIGNYLLLKSEQKPLEAYGLTLEEVALD